MISKRITKTTPLSFFFLPLVLFLASCASEVGNSNDEKKTSSNVVNPSQVLKTIGDLPACNSESEGSLYYIESISQFRYCSSTGSYASIDLTGPQGPAGADGKDGEDGVVTTTDGTQGVAGPQGPAGADGKDGEDGAQGPQGLAGADGADNRAIYTIACFEPFTAFGTTYNYDYAIVGLSSGDIIVTSEVSGTDIGVSKTLYYSKFQNAAITTSGRFGGINLTADIFQTNNAGYFRFEINPNSLAIEMEYHDSQLPLYGYANPQTLSLNTSGSGCVRNAY
jgi:hypothetical protein